MPDERSFIAADAEYERFSRLSERYPREVRRFASGAWQRGGGGVRPLTDVVRFRARDLKESEIGWAGLVVSVEEGDGMTWSAAEVARVVKRAAPEFQQRHIVPSSGPGRLPDLAPVIPGPRILALAQDTGVVPKLPTLRRGPLVLAALAVFALGAVAAVVSALQKAAVVNLQFLVLGGVVALLAIAVPELQALFKRDKREAERQKAIEGIRVAAAAREPSWLRLVDALEDELARCHTDRCVIVDDFHRLDDTTAHVLRNYILERHETSGARELWVVFDEAELGALTKAIMSSLAADSGSPAARSSCRPCASSTSSPSSARGSPTKSAPRPTGPSSGA